MLTLLTSLMIFATPSDQLDCNYNYSWLENGQEKRVKGQWNLPLKKRTYGDIVRLYVEKVWTTPDERFEVVIQGLNPVSGDITTFKQTQITVTDTKTMTYTLSHPLSFGYAKSPITQAYLYILPENHDSVIPHGLGIECELK